MNVFQRVKGLLYKTAPAVTPGIKTAVLSRTDAQTGVKQPMYARQPLRNEQGLPSERFDPRRQMRAVKQSGQSDDAAPVYETPPTVPRDRLGFGFKTELM